MLVGVAAQESNPFALTVDPYWILVSLVQFVILYLLQYCRETGRQNANTVSLGTQLRNALGRQCVDVHNKIAGRRLR